MSLSGSDVGGVSSSHRRIEDEAVRPARVLHHLLDELIVQLGWAATVELHDERCCRVHPQAECALLGVGCHEHEGFLPSQLVHDDDAQVRQESILDVEDMTLLVDQSAQLGSSSF